MTSIFYYLLVGFALAFSCIPFRILYLISDGLYFFIYYIVRYRKSTVFKNLRIAFPEKSEKEIVVLAKLFYRHFADFLVEITKCMGIRRSVQNKRMKILNPEVLNNLAARKQNFAIVSAHYNNWEWLNILAISMTHKLLPIYRPLKNKVADRFTKKMRERYGTIMFPMDSIYREGLKFRNAGQMFAIWFLADQRPPRNSRFWVRFLNQEAAFFEGAEKISRKLGMAVVFLDIQKVRRGYYEVALKVLFEDASKSKENEITLACVREIENEIRKKPEYWLWSHKRFKHARPENINLITT